ncbi:MAG: c-type cytochrome [Candidatus Marinimicrobia bacterium]|nr:c-type cytochrome [Candidatus Neomarinimicrobiota bacterium]
MSILLVILASVLGMVHGLGAKQRQPKQESEGLKIFTEYKCGTCHSIASLGIVLFAESTDEDEDDEDEDEEKEVETPDLSDVGMRHDAKWISSYLRKKISQNGRKHKKRFQGTPEERRSLAFWLESMKTVQKDSTSGDTKPNSL